MSVRPSHVVPPNHPWRHDLVLRSREEEDRASERERVRRVEAALEKLVSKADVEPLDPVEADSVADARLVAEIVASATRRDFSGVE